MPITYILAKDFNVAANIIRAQVAPNQVGKLVLELSGDIDELEAALEWMRLHNIDVCLASREILINENCKLIKIKLNDLTKKHPNLDANIIGIIRDEKFLIPKKNDDIRKNDKIYVIINSSQMSETL